MVSESRHSPTSSTGAPPLVLHARPTLEVSSAVALPRCRQKADTKTPTFGIVSNNLSPPLLVPINVMHVL